MGTGRVIDRASGEAFECDETNYLRVVAPELFRLGDHIKTTFAVVIDVASWIPCLTPRLGRRQDVLHIGDHCACHRFLLGASDTLHGSFHPIGITFGVVGTPTSYSRTGRWDRGQRQEGRNRKAPREFLQECFPLRGNLRSLCCYRHCQTQVRRQLRRLHHRTHRRSLRHHPHVSAGASQHGETTRYQRSYQLRTDGQQKPP